MTDAEKIEWLTATNNALMESQERLAAEVKETQRERDEARSVAAHFKAQLREAAEGRLEAQVEVERLQKENAELRKLLRHFFGNGGGIPYAQWTTEQHAAYDLLQKDK